MSENNFADTKTAFKFIFMNNNKTSPKKLYVQEILKQNCRYKLQDGDFKNQR